MFDIVNKNLLKHPLNWLVIWSMVLIFGYVAHLAICYYAGKHPGAASGDTASGPAGPGTSTNTVNPNPSLAAS